MARAIWTGAISFGLVNVPVKLYSATSPKTVRFHQLEQTGRPHPAEARRSLDGEEVAFEDIVKGYELTPDHYVVIEPEELEALEPKAKTIDIEDFVDLAEIDPIYYDHPYYLAPGDRRGEALQAAADAMEESGKVAIGRVVIRSKEQLVAIRPTGDILTMETMNFADEVIPHDRFDELPGEDVDTNEREVDMARQLIDSLSGEFDPAKYKDNTASACCN